MEISSELNKEILKKSEEGLVKTLKFILEQSEVKKVFPSFKIEKTDQNKLELNSLAKTTFDIKYLENLDLSIKQFRDDVIQFRDILKQISPDYRLREFFSDEIFHENGELKTHYKKMDAMLDPHNHFPKHRYAGIDLAFIRDITRQSIVVDLSDEERNILALEGIIEKEISFLELIRIHFSHYGKIEYEWDTRWQPKI